MESNGLVAPMPRPIIPSTIYNPTKKEKKSVSRNLFGSVPPGSVEEELRNEKKLKVKEFGERYEFDYVLVSAENKAATPLLNLIEQESKQYQKRLAERDVEKEEKCNSPSEKLQENAETTPQPHRNSSSNSNVTAGSNLSKSCGSKHHNHSHDGRLESQNGNSTRSVPYQKRVLECFQVRKRSKSQQSVKNKRRL